MYDYQRDLDEMVSVTTFTGQKNVALGDVVPFMQAQDPDAFSQAVENQNCSSGQALVNYFQSYCHGSFVPDL